MDGAVSRVGEEEPPVDTPGRDQTFFQPLHCFDQAGEPCGGARVDFTIDGGEAFWTESRVQGEGVGETKGTSGAIAHGEVRHTVH